MFYLLIHTGHLLLYGINYLRFKNHGENKKIMMGKIRRVVLDTLKPMTPTIIEMAKMLEPEIISLGVTSCAAIFALILIFILQVNVFSSIGLMFVFLSGLAEALIILFMNKIIRITSMTYYVMMTMFVPVINLILGISFLNETINFIQLIGGIVLIISGIMVQRLRD